MRLLLLLGLSALILFVSLPGATVPVSPAWHHLSVAPMKTSIYFGTVTLIPGELVRQGPTLTATYEARVFPWFFWGESGQIVISLSDEELARLAKKETVDFVGQGSNTRHKPRTVTGRAQPSDETSGKFKIRIKADGYELIFNGTYRLGRG